MGTGALIIRPYADKANSEIMELLLEFDSESENYGVMYWHNLAGDIVPIETGDTERLSNHILNSVVIADNKPVSFDASTIWFNTALTDSDKFYSAFIKATNETGDAFKIIFPKTIAENVTLYRDTDNEITLVDYLENLDDRMNLFGGRFPTDTKFYANFRYATTIYNKVDGSAQNPAGHVNKYFEEGIVDYGKAKFIKNENMEGLTLTTLINGDYPVFYYEDRNLNLNNKVVYIRGNVSPKTFNPVLLCTELEYDNSKLTIELDSRIGNNAQLGEFKAAISFRENGEVISSYCEVDGTEVNIIIYSPGVQGVNTVIGGPRQRTVDVISEYLEIDRLVTTKAGLENLVKCDLRVPPTTQVGRAPNCIASYGPDGKISGVIMNDDDNLETLNDKQSQTSDELVTEDKTVVGSINEVVENRRIVTYTDDDNETLGIVTTNYSATDYTVSLNEIISHLPEESMYMAQILADDVIKFLGDGRGSAVDSILLIDSMATRSASIKNGGDIFECYNDGSVWTEWKRLATQDDVDANTAAINLRKIKSFYTTVGAGVSFTVGATFAEICTTLQTQLTNDTMLFIPSSGLVTAIHQTLRPVATIGIYEIYKDSNGMVHATFLSDTNMEYRMVIKSDGSNTGWSLVYGSNTKPTPSDIGAEPAFSKNTGFNLAKTDSYTDTSSDKLTTGKALTDGLATKSGTGHTHTYLPLAGGTMTGKILYNIAVGEAILSVGGTASGISKTTDQNGLALYCDSSLLLFAGDTYTKITTGLLMGADYTTENVYVAADNEIVFLPGQQSGYDASKIFKIDTSGRMVLNGWTVSIV